MSGTPVTTAIRTIHTAMVLTVICTHPTTLITLTTTRPLDFPTTIRITLITTPTIPTIAVPTPTIAVPTPIPVVPATIRIIPITVLAVPTLTTITHREVGSSRVPHQGEVLAAEPTDDKDL